MSLFDSKFSTACPGCGQEIAAKIVVDIAGKNTIISNATGCLEVFSSKYPDSAWKVPWVHSLFENSAAVASGVEAALKHLGKLKDIKVIAQAGDGGTADIGLQALSGMFERGQDILFCCYDNEAYENTGVQRSGLTPLNTNTTTTPPGKESVGNTRPKKPMLEICAAHKIPYVASASIGFIKDLKDKVKKALSIRGPKYLQIFVPCPLGWRHGPELTMKIAKLAVETGLYPLVEFENGKLTSAMKIPQPKPVEEYLKLQGRFKHLLKNKQELQRIEETAKANIESFGL
ncbi:MAG: pyruvate ferredoxin oxidoreductase [Candidatus Omnitrophica bacterium]|nr:pyruvate ferredoxin oxidoreductase [Candidatus Omnitrophota bacterium]